MDGVAKNAFFFEKDLHPGKKLELFDFHESPTTNVSFLPRKEADLLPFSTSNLQEILQIFSLDPNTVEANATKDTLKICEERPLEGEIKFCATSLESMIDFIVSTLSKRNKTKVLSSQLDHDTTNNDFTLVTKKTIPEQVVICHKSGYPYAVYYCHSFENTRAYVASLVGKDRTRVSGVAVCHEDTSSWSPGHIAFVLLKVKPGTVPICHFLATHTLVWLISI